MAKKKEKPKIINNIEELNLEIDYDKLAEAIVKAQSHSDTIESYNSTDYEYIGKTLSGKTKRNYFSFSIEQLVAWLFYAIRVVEVYFSTIFVSKVADYSYNLALSRNNSELYSRIMYIGVAIAFVFVSMIVFCILWNIANEIKKEKDRNYIMSVFSGIVSFAALIVALVALFKGVG